jgi:hypothetical protein
MADLIERLKAAESLLVSDYAYKQAGAVRDAITALSQEREAREALQTRFDLELDAYAKDAEVAALRASLAEAKRLLKPFADIGGGLGAAWLDHETHWSSIHDNIAVRDLRAAGRFLSQEPNHER